MIRFLIKASALCVGIFSLLLIWRGLVESQEPHDIAVVFGSKIEEDGTPSKRLQARLNRAFKVWEQGRCTFILVSGGVVEWDESAVMKDYLIQSGVPEEFILTDPKGNNTRLTAQHTKQALLRMNGRSVLAISQYFHLARCRMALEQEGIATVASNYARYVEPRDLYSLLREIPAYLKYSLYQRSTPQNASLPLAEPQIQDTKASQ